MHAYIHTHERKTMRMCMYACAVISNHSFHTLRRVRCESFRKQSQQSYATFRKCCTVICIYKQRDIMSDRQTDKKLVSDKQIDRQTDKLHKACRCSDAAPRACVTMHENNGAHDSHVTRDMASRTQSKLGISLCAFTQLTGVCKEACQPVSV